MMKRASCDMEVTLHGLQGFGFTRKNELFVGRVAMIGKPFTHNLVELLKA